MFLVWLGIEAAAAHVLPADGVTVLVASVDPQARPPAIEPISLSGPDVAAIFLGFDNSGAAAQHVARGFVVHHQGMATFAVPKLMQGNLERHL